MIRVYGTPLCKDCLAMKVVFGKLNIEYDFVNITSKSTELAAFIRMRDEEQAFEKCRKNGSIGIPFFVKNDKKTFDINEALSWEGFEPIDADEINRITEECIMICK